MNKDDNFSNIFSSLFGNEQNRYKNTNCDSCGYKIFLDKIKYIKNKMINDIKKARASKYKTKSEYDAEISKSYNEIFKYIRNI